MCERERLREKNREEIYDCNKWERFTQKSKNQIEVNKCDTLEHNVLFWWCKYIWRPTCPFIGKEPHFPILGGLPCLQAWEGKAIKVEKS